MNAREQFIEPGLIDRLPRPFDSEILLPEHIRTRMILDRQRTEGERGLSILRGGICGGTRLSQYKYRK
ncbi:hypothetical protein QQ054_11045 [Oscillatoria amoena NRMC-F 0135]|nr:hypothetical protein [Oscillatoria amoena NRMC-F 0135]